VFMHLDVNETGIAGSSVLRDVIVQELVQQGLEGSSFNASTYIQLISI